MNALLDPLREEPCNRFVNHKIKEMTLFTYKELDTYMSFFIKYSIKSALDYDGFINILKEFNSPLQCGNSITRLLFSVFTPTQQDYMNQIEYVLAIAILANKCSVMNIYHILYDIYKIVSVDDLCDIPFTNTNITPKQLFTQLQGFKFINFFGFIVKCISIEEFKFLFNI